MEYVNDSFSTAFHWSCSVLSITIVVSLILIISAFYIYFDLRILWFKYLLITILMATVVIGLGYMPIRLKATNKAITLTRLIGPLEIPLNTIINIKEISQFDIDKSIKVFGSDGLFGYFGRFKNKKLGNYTMYATEFKNLILIQTNNKTYVFSCTHAKDFVKYVNAQL